MLVLVGCEFSGTVRRAFREHGHDAWSCDLVPATDVSPYHIQADVFDVIEQCDWDLGIFHPPCTFLSRAGCHMLKEDGREYWIQQAADFFNRLYHCKIPKVAIENPIPHKYARSLIGRYDQIVYPYEHGDPYTKPICLWLKGLPLLRSTNRIRGHIKVPHGTNPGEARQRLRSIFFPGVSNAMAMQWGNA